MLDHGADAQSIAQAVAALPCHVVLPAAWKDFFRKTGQNGQGHDRRRLARLHCRGRAAIEHRQTLPALSREPAWCGVYTLDVTRRGVGFLHTEQLYPGERMRLALAEGMVQIIHIVWCRRIQGLCYEIGARFIDSFEAALGED